MTAVLSLSPPHAVAQVEATAADKTGAVVRVQDIEHRYGGSLAVAGISLETEPGELVALLGPSGCGKTTLLRIVAGLLRQSAGQVQIGGRNVDALPTTERGVGIVFQNYALFPHMTVEANVGYGLRARGVAKADCARAVASMLEMVRMAAFRQRYPRELSGGQQQRVALARTLAVRPQVLLLDEPFGALDKNLRLDMQIEIRRIQRELGVTALLVTHDQEEAMSMADRIAVIHAGRIEQFDTPEMVYDHPASLFVARFVGTANLIGGRLCRVGQCYELHCNAGGCLQLPTAGPCSRDGAVQLAARPEHLMLTAPTPDKPTATVGMVLPLGPSLVYELTLSDGSPLKVTLPRDGSAARYAAGQTVGVDLRPGAPSAVFVPESARV